MIARTIGRQKPPQENQNRDEPQERPKILYLPYVRNTSEEIERDGRKSGVKVVFKLYGTIWQALTRVKTPREDLEKKDVVYELWTVTQATLVRQGET